ncbi:MAG: 50S ribosomal protein L6 [Planctomycetota bacterium]|nr:MAG: 50S ribosomal protein L6 [Planctomycetota bacterium]
MSRIGSKEVSIPAGVTVTVASAELEVKGPKGTLRFPLFPEVRVQVDGATARVSQSGAGDGRRAAALHGLVRAYLNNMVTGVSQGYSKSLEIQGTGWNAKPAGSGAELALGFSASVKVQPPAGVTLTVVSPTEIQVSGADKQAVGQFAADLRAIRPPEPYKGKGIRYKGEEVRRKVGKSLA